MVGAPWLVDPPWFSPPPPETIRGAVEAKIPKSMAAFLALGFKKRWFLKISSKNRMDTL